MVCGGLQVRDTREFRTVTEQRPIMKRIGLLFGVLLSIAVLGAQGPVAPPGRGQGPAGTVLPTVTDGFGGRAPDLGALEVGATAPHYGPRP
jgi:hypothetical protein